MTEKDKEFRRHLLETFRAETEDHVRTITSGLLELEKHGWQPQILENIYRVTHSMKGAARAVNLSGIEMLCQSLEGVFSVLKQKDTGLTLGMFDVLYSAVDAINSLISKQEEQALIPHENIQALERLLKAGKTKPAARDKAYAGYEPEDLRQPHAAGAEPAEPKPAAETIRVATAKLDALLLEAEELLTPKLAARERIRDLRRILATINQMKQEGQKVWTLLKKKGWDEKVAQGKLLEFVEQTDMHLKVLEGNISAIAKTAEHESRSFGRLVDNLIEETKGALMLPVSAVLNLLPRMVRDLARDRGKETEIVIRGADIEVDKRILEEMKDPVIHLVRNCIDHGIEKPEEREKHGKPQKGTIAITVYRESSGHIRLNVSDDGKGIDIADIRATALKKGLLPSDAEALTEQEAVSLIFSSGFSTSPIITDISGRGLGLTIVKEKVEKLGGSISVESRPHEGASFSMLFPLSLATFRGLIAAAAEQMFVFPLIKVEKVIRVRPENIRTVENRETITDNNRTISFARLEEVLGLQKGAGPAKEDLSTEYVTVVIVCALDKCIAFGVDKLVSEQEVLVKTLGRQLTRVRNIAGATILGTGKVVPVFDADELVMSAVKGTSAPAVIKAGKEKTEKAGVAKRHILVVEDSITSRMLLRNILESAGYSVKTAVDGIEGFTALKTEEFDLVVSDVEMPRMNGFELTAKIRSDARVSELPVVLVTALDSKEDRERGVDAGANAYIVKSSFDQGSLLDVVKRLV